MWRERNESCLDHRKSNSDLKPSLDRHLRYTRLVSSLTLSPLQSLPHYTIEQLVRRVYRFLCYRSGGHYLEVNLLLPGQPQASDDTRAQVDQRPIDARQMGMWVEHAPPPGQTVVYASPIYGGTQQLLRNCLPLRECAVSPSLTARVTCRKRFTRQKIFAWP